jgi:Zn-dependent membrane protease YugP
MEYLIPALILSLFAQYKVKSTFNKYLKVETKKRESGAQAARAILNNSGLHHVQIEQVSGTLSDHYDPRSEVLRLSSDVYNGRSIASVGVAAHEAGHAIQHDHTYVPLMVRNAIVPVVNIASRASSLFILLGLIISGFQALLDIGILLFSAAVLFQIITLPVEFNASNRAKKVLVDYGIVDAEEGRQVAKVLNAAALTYVAAAVTAIMQLLRLVALRNRRN